MTGQETEGGAARVDPRWCVAVDGLDPEQERAREALFALADGRIGVGGATLADHPGRRTWAYASGVYDGDGPLTNLLHGPVGLDLPYAIEPGAPLRRVLDLRDGVVWEDADCDGGLLRAVRFCSLARPGIVVLRYDSQQRRSAVLLQPATDGAAAEEGVDGDVSWMVAGGDPDNHGGIVAAAQELDAAETGAQGDGPSRVTRVIAYEALTERRPDRATAVRRAREAAAVGFDALYAEHRDAWAARWEAADIAIEGDDELQAAVRFALFHLTVCAHDEGEAAVGARGLTGGGYRGHVFWDADTFVLPFLAATRPAAARAMLEYRIRRLPAARDIAHIAGRSGARFPWESARSGRDVTPTSALDWTGRRVPIRTGHLEDGIVADVAWAATCYSDWTGDEEFARGPGLLLLVETARYWQSRTRWTADGAAHIYGVIGPDEYHEPVDDNAYTNVMARWNLRAAADAVEANPPGEVDVGADEPLAWRATAAALVDGYNPGTGLYEQFAGFHRLEPLVIEEVAPRRPIAADLLLGPERVHGAQVLKQADVLMLHHLIPDEVVKGSLEPNLRYYEPRTAHGSSLSPPVHAGLLARIREFGPALEALRIAAFMDRDDLSQSTASGLHLATMGGLWQALVFGFAGIRPRDGRLQIDPRLPPDWGSFEVRVQFHQSRVRVRCEAAGLTVHADPPAAVSIGDTPYTADAAGLQLRSRGRDWELVT